MEIQLPEHAQSLLGAKCFLFIPKEPNSFLNLQGTPEDLNFTTANTREYLIQGMYNKLIAFYMKLKPINPILKESY